MAAVYQCMQSGALAISGPVGTITAEQTASLSGYAAGVDTVFPAAVLVPSIPFLFVLPPPPFVSACVLVT